MKNHFDNVDQVNNLREIQALQRLSPNPYIVKLYEVLYDQPTGRLALVFELMNMNAYELIRGRRHYLPESTIKNYMHQLIKAMDHMHRSGIFHRDIKPENILIRGDVLKVADFGSCRGIYSKQPYTEYISTRWYRAPECLLTDGYYGYKMDMWGVGCVMFEIVALYPLFPGTNELDQIKKIHKILGTPSEEVLMKFKAHGASHIDFDFPYYRGKKIAKSITHISAECVDLIKMLIRYEPENRLSARQALRHPWFLELRDAPNRDEKPLESGRDVATDKMSSSSRRFRNRRRFKSGEVSGTNIDNFNTRRSNKVGGNIGIDAGDERESEEGGEGLHASLAVAPKWKSRFKSTLKRRERRGHHSKRNHQHEDREYRDDDEDSFVEQGHTDNSGALRGSEYDTTQQLDLHHSTSSTSKLSSMSSLPSIMKNKRFTAAVEPLTSMPTSKVYRQVQQHHKTGNAKQIGYGKYGHRNLLKIDSRTERGGVGKTTHSTQRLRAYGSLNRKNQKRSLKKAKHVRSGRLQRNLSYQNATQASNHPKVTGHRMNVGPSSVARRATKKASKKYESPYSMAYIQRMRAAAAASKNPRR